MAQTRDGFRGRATATRAKVPSADLVAVGPRSKLGLGSGLPVCFRENSFSQTL